MKNLCYSSKLYVARLRFVSGITKDNVNNQIGMEHHQAAKLSLIYKVDDNKYMIIANNSTKRVKTEKDKLELYDYYVDTYRIAPLSQFVNLDTQTSWETVQKYEQIVRSTSKKEELTKTLTNNTNATNYYEMI